MRPLSRTLTAAASAALAALLALPAAAAAQPETLIPDAGWFVFSFSGLGPISSPADGYALTLSTPGTLRIVDFGAIGDVFTLTLTGPPDGVLATSPILPGTDGADSGALDGDEAWADGRLSRGELTLGPGSYTIHIDVTRLAANTTAGEGLISVSSVPEPGTVALVAGGLGLLALAGIRRRAPRDD